MKIGKICHLVILTAVIIILAATSAVLYKWTNENLKTLPAYKLEKPNFVIQEPKDHKVIWSFWHDENWPPLAIVCIKSWMHHNPGYIINMMSMQTFGKFVEQQELPKMFSELSIQHKADVIRLCVLKRFGGYWLDATLFLNQPLALLWEPMNYDIGGYNGDHFQTKGSKKIVFENWFIAAPKGSQLISDWHTEYVGSFNRFTQSSYDANRTEYLTELMERNVDLQLIKYVRPKYFSMHCAFLAITYKPNNYRIKHLNVDMQWLRARTESIKKLSPLSYNNDSMLPFLPCTGCFKSMLTSTYYDYLPMIKFCGTARKAIEEIWYMLEKNSTLGKIAFQ